eukprot:TRINITY_DN4259_c0_g1_i11.p1 TRINITY_DN4259_c0_g1~~TRINITY_DN4259_c0_g1_i11.p1  ORF type:complete len:309 (+),score=21.37 TRINITY_DN4259_c0_g1_i11:73-999(+)
MCIRDRYNGSLIIKCKLVPSPWLNTHCPASLTSLVLIAAVSYVFLTIVNHEGEISSLLMGKEQARNTIYKQNISEILLADEIDNSSNKEYVEEPFPATQYLKDNTKTLNISAGRFADKDKQKKVVPTVKERALTMHSRNGLSSLMLAQSTDLSKTLNKLQETEMRFKEVLASSKDFLKSQVTMPVFSEKENHFKVLPSNEAESNSRTDEPPKKDHPKVASRKLTQYKEPMPIITKAANEELPNIEYASNRTESIFKEYVKKMTGLQTFKGSYIKRISVATFLRYIEFETHVLCVDLSLIHICRCRRAI